MPEESTVRKPADPIALGFGDSQLTFHSPEPADASRPVEHFMATLTLPGLQASAQIYTFMSESLPKLFNDMAADWSGWEGEKMWESFEGDIRLSCSHDGHSYVNVEIHLRVQNSIHNMWNVEGTVRVEPGTLDSLAKHAGRFFRQ